LAIQRLVTEPDIFPDPVESDQDAADRQMLNRDWPRARGI
jgi:hypothetical protein